MKVIITWVMGICILLACGIAILDITFRTGLTFGAIRMLSHVLLGGVSHAVQSLPHALSARVSPLILVALLLILGSWIATVLPATHPVRPWQHLARRVAKVLGGVSVLILGATAWANATSNAVRFIMHDAIASPDRTWTGEAISKARTLTTALRIYASENGGSYPRDLSELVETGVLDQKAFAHLVTAVESDGVPVPWIYLHGFNESSPHSTPLIMSQLPGRGGKRVAAFNDSSVSLILARDYDHAVKKWKENVGEIK